MEQAYARSYVSGPRWAGLDEFLCELAFKHHLRIEITNQIKKLLRVTYFFTVYGDSDDIERFIKECKNTIESYNIF